MRGSGTRMRRRRTAGSRRCTAICGVGLDAGLAQARAARSDDLSGAKRTRWAAAWTAGSRGCLQTRQAGKTLDEPAPIEGFTAVTHAMLTARRYQREEKWHTERALSRFAQVLGRLEGVDPPKAVIYFADRMRSNAGDHYIELFADASEAGPPAAGRGWSVGARRQRSVQPGAGRRRPADLRPGHRRSGGPRRAALHRAGRGTGRRGVGNAGLVRLSQLPVAGHLRRDEALHRREERSRRPGAGNRGTSVSQRRGSGQDRPADRGRPGLRLPDQLRRRGAARGPQAAAERPGGRPQARDADPGPAGRAERVGAPGLAPDQRVQPPRRASPPTRGCAR